MKEMISKHVEKMAPSGIREFFDLVLGMPDVISLGVGEPDFITPWRIREKAITALEEGVTSYTSNQGLFLLRDSIADHLKTQYRLNYKPDKEILITVGVSEGLDLSLRAILEPKDKVIVVAPYYVAYPALVELNHGKVLLLETKQEDNFKIDPKKLSQLLKQNPKAIILNYPSNPSGATYTAPELKKIWNLLAKKELIVISDETYDLLTYGQKHICFPSLAKSAKEKTILLNGFSKGHAMTGFRVGFACGSSEIIQAMTKIHSYSVMCGPVISQVAATEALLAKKEVKTMKTEYMRRRDFLVEELGRLGFSVSLPQGAFYCFASLEKFKFNSLDFAKKLLVKEKVAVVPGLAFGKNYKKYIRLSYANSLDNLKEAIVRIERFLKSL
ncbi:MAG: aminotransferase class I/II-fold pyridoxal phosphate-dependent enzyme [Candidatus Omnitrophica bacterium]|nr:aminotransferase class I/II-fold pyridoxal phosphate-dependent enzyme [Candidatus Omnitrophota bacterium]MCF7894010.1 aminotransferase class I/II-fold pyridoxal phosphate-dependent enzyme [Candidatus Omnitrophota bacterium]